MRSRIEQVIGEKFAAVEDDVSLFVFRDELRVGRGDEKILAIDLVTAFGEKADVRRRCRAKIENAQRSLAAPETRKLSQSAGTAREFLSGLRGFPLRATR